MIKQKLILFFLFFIVVTIGLSLTQSVAADEDGHLVTGFNAFSTDGYMSGLAVRIVETDQFGRLVTAHETKQGNNHLIRVHRHLSNGDLDLSFGNNGRADISIPNLNFKLFVEAIDFQRDGTGKILIAISQDIGDNGSYDFVVVRLTADGNLDQTFNILPKTFSDDVDRQGLGDMAIQEDGKIVLVGSVPDCGIILCDSDIGAVRYNSDGTFDPSFGRGGFTRLDLGGQDEIVSDIQLTNDGRIAIFGKQIKNSSDSIFIAGRLMPDGSRDNTFGQNGFIGHDIDFRFDGNGVVFDDDTMAVASFSQGVAKLKADGLLDQSFGTAGLLDVSATGISQVHTILANPDKSFFIAGFSNRGGENHTRMAKYSATGRLDLSFGENGVSQFPANEASNFVRHLTFAQDGRLFMTVGTGNTHLNKMLFRILPNGQLDTGGWVINNITSFDDSITDMVIQPNGKIVAIGNILDSGTGLARYNPDGSFDPSFGFGRGYLTNGTPRNYGLAAAVDSAERIIAVQGIVDLDNGINFKVPRYAPNGLLALWPSGRPINGMIGNWGGVTDFATEIELFPDESFIVIGSSDGVIAATRYTNRGSLDLSYGGGGTGTSKAHIAAGFAFASGSALQNDGKLIITGTVAKKLFIMRLNTDGGYDSTFNGNGLVVLDIPNSAHESFNDVAVLPNGQIIAVGSVSRGDHTELLAMRFNSDGSLDTTFFDNARLEIGLSGNAALHAVTLDEDGSIMMAGCVRDIVGHFVVVRLEPNGSIEFDFDDDGVLILDETPTMGGACAHAIARDEDTGEFVLAGYTTNVEGRQQFALTRIKMNLPPASPPPTPTTEPTPTFEPTSTPEPSPTPNPTSTPNPNPSGDFTIYFPLIVK